MSCELKEADFVIILEEIAKLVEGEARELIEQYIERIKERVKLRIEACLAIT